MKKTIIFIRHGESLGQTARARGLSRKDSSLLDADLSPKGQRQAKDLKKDLLIQQYLCDIDLVIISPLTRALRTATLGFKHLSEKVPFVCYPGLKERNNNKKKVLPENIARPIEKIVKENKMLQRVSFDLIPLNWPPDSSSYTLDRFNDWLLARPETTIVVVCHLNIIRTLVPRYDQTISNCTPILCSLDERNSFQLFTKKSGETKEEKRATRMISSQAVLLDQVKKREKYNSQCATTIDATKTNNTSPTTDATTTTTTKLTHDLVTKAVNEYGMAWKTQDVDRISQLFSENAIYVERPFDATATMRGNNAIRSYWETQIIGKQSNIKFRHVVSEMVLDSDRYTAVVKWLAEFDNIRHKRDTKYKRVAFCQVAKLIFTKDCKQIEYLEEYSQSTSDARFNWPPCNIESTKLTTDESLWDMVRNEPNAFETPGKIAICESCNAEFSSRTKLFRHLKSTSCGIDPSDSTVHVNDNKYNPPSIGIYGKLMKICVSCSYTTYNIPMEEMDSYLRQMIVEGIENVFEKYLKGNDHSDHSSTSKNTFLISWAVPPRRSKHAALNVLSINLPETVLQSVGGNYDMLTKQLNVGLRLCEKKRKGKESDVLQKCASIFIRKCNKIDRSFNPAIMCEFEKYEALVPFYMLLPKGTTLDEGDETKDTMMRMEVAKKIKNAVRLFSGVEKSFHNFTTMKRGSGKKSTHLTLKRIRSCGLSKDSSNNVMLISKSAPLSSSLLSRSWVTFTVPIKWHLQDLIGKIVGAIISIVRGEKNPEDIECAFDEENIDSSIPVYPSELIYLVTPAMTRMENKKKIKCTLGKFPQKDLSFTGTNLLEEIAQQIVQWEEKDNKLKGWPDSSLC
jgi:broad specificity phosphatase PhoE/tRNA U38,U39,U40 pseudouridine synthase TruA